MITIAPMARSSILRSRLATSAVPAMGWSASVATRRATHVRRMLMWAGPPRMSTNSSSRAAAAFITSGRAITTRDAERLQAQAGLQAPHRHNEGRYEYGAMG